MEPTRVLPDVSTPTLRYRQLEKSRELVRDLCGGTDVMIKAGEKWLVKLPEEDELNYQMRLKQNILTDFVKQAIEKSAGKIFSKPITFKEDVPPDVIELCKNIDRQGRTIDAYMFNRASMGFQDGVSYVLVDLPEKGPAVTRAEELAAEIRPYLVDVDANALLECTSKMVGSSLVLVRVRILENAREADGEWGERIIPQIRVLRRDEFLDSEGKPDTMVWYELHRKDAAGKWFIYKSGMTSFKAIPLFPMYANMTGFMEGEPVFRSTAELNLEHWRSKSEQLNALMFGRFAMLGGSGVKNEDVLKVGPNMSLFTSDPQGKFYYVESNGIGLDHGWKHLQSIEKSIETASATLRIENQGRLTATAAAIDSDETNATIKVIAMGMQECIDNILDVLAEAMGNGPDAGGHVEINTNFGTKKGTEVGLQEINKLVVSRFISGKAAIQNLIWRGELPTDFDFEENDEDLKSQPSPILPNSSQIEKGNGIGKGKTDKDGE